MNTLVTIAQQQPEPSRTFRAFRTVDAAIAYTLKMPKWREPALSIRHYGHGVTRAVVNFYGSNRRHKVSLAKARWIMYHGMTVNRALPVRVS